MLKDMKDSERINREVKKLNQDKNGDQEMQSDQNVSGAFDVSKLYIKVVGSGYWEKVQDDDIPPKQEDSLDSQVKEPQAKLAQGFNPDTNVKNSLSEFNDYYKLYRTNRNLVFYQNYGKVELALTFANGKFPFQVTPLQASIIAQFDTNH